MVGAVVTVLLVRASGTATVVALSAESEAGDLTGERPLLEALVQEIETLGARMVQMSNEMNQLRGQQSALESSFHTHAANTATEMDQLRLLYLKVREDSTRQLAAATKSSAMRDAELRREVEPARRLQAVQ